MVNINSTIINNLYNEAETSTLQHRLAAAVVHNNKQLSNSCCNINRNLCRRKHIPSIHAEANALLNFYSNKIYFSKYRGWCFYDNEYRCKKINIMVIRITRECKLANARPCKNCCQMMKDLGVNKVHYSSGNENEIITEHIKDMFSIQDSSSSRYFERMFNTLPTNDIDYYKYILQKNAPKKLKRTNLENFIRFNLKELLPTCLYVFVNHKGHDFIQIYDLDKLITKIEIL